MNELILDLNLACCVLTGLLIEPSLNYTTLLKRNRKVISVNACLATTNIPQVVEFLSYQGIGGIKGNITTENIVLTTDLHYIRFVCLSYCYVYTTTLIL